MLDLQPDLELTTVQAERLLQAWLGGPLECTGIRRLHGGLVNSVMLLEFDRPPGAARCRACGEEFETAEMMPLCTCGSADVGVTGGAGLRIREVEVDSACAPPADARTRTPE